MQRSLGYGSLNQPLQIWVLYTQSLNLKLQLLRRIGKELMLFVS